MFCRLGTLVFLQSGRLLVKCVLACKDWLPSTHCAAVVRISALPLVHPAFHIAYNRAMDWDYAFFPGVFDAGVLWAL